MCCLTANHHGDCSWPAGSGFSQVGHQSSPHESPALSHMAVLPADISCDLGRCHSMSATVRSWTISPPWCCSQIRPAVTGTAAGGSKLLLSKCLRKCQLQWRRLRLFMKTTNGVSACAEALCCAAPFVHFGALTFHNVRHLTGG